MATTFGEYFLGGWWPAALELDSAANALKDEIRNKYTGYSET